MGNFREARYVTARKWHMCDDCGRDILPGTRYHYVVESYYGDFHTAHDCEHCAAAWEYVYRQSCDDEYTLGGLFDHLGYIEDIPAARMRAGVKAQWTFMSGRPMPVPVTP